uniref:Uncharacterized protein n=1 Tax=Neobodo designis TaxID=312471 RepID=A0A7S1LEA8_NEODS
MDTSAGRWTDEADTLDLAETLARGELLARRTSEFVAIRSSFDRITAVLLSRSLDGVPRSPSPFAPRSPSPRQPDQRTLRSRRGFPAAASPLSVASPSSELARSPLASSTTPVAPDPTSALSADIRMLWVASNRRAINESIARKRALAPMSPAATAHAARATPDLTATAPLPAPERSSSFPKRHLPGIRRRESGP